MPPIADLPTLLAALAPVRQPGVYAYASWPAERPAAALAALAPLATFREPEGLTVIVEAAAARAAGLPIALTCAWITLTVPSALAAVGLTAAIARALTDAGVACNVVAAVYHDHLFVPIADADAALAALAALSARAPPGG